VRATLASTKALPTTLEVLVAEDSPMNQRVALGMLERLGYEGILVANGLEAVEAVQHQRFAAILMDCQMPEMDGFAATAEIRRQEPVGQHLPIIAMTANAMKGDRERCLEAGMDDYISKPVRFEDLQMALQRWAPRESIAPDLSPVEADGAADVAEPIDERAIASLRATFRSGHDDILPTLVREFRLSTEQQLSALRVAVEQGDPSTLASAAHRLKGDAAMIGATAVRARCADIEVLGRTASAQWSAEAQTLLPSLAADISSALAALDQYRGDPP
jgi:CheY-like chemotaxis protein/HPt (histidine-containing phosphotransfer) domain-containing protein